MVAIVLLATGLRAATLRADLPYATYNDEHFVLKASAHQIADATWDPAFYGYPSFLVNATSLLATGIAAGRGQSATLADGARATQASRYIEIVEPWTLVLAGRLLVLALSVATVVLVGLLGMRLAGRRVGILAALLVAALPMFVTRGSIVIVDTAATCFAVAALYCAARVTAAERRRDLVLWAALGGAASALAFTSKYTIGSVLLAVLAVIALRGDRSIGDRLRLALVAVATFVASAVLVMPALVLRTAEVIDAIRAQEHAYAIQRATDSYLHALFQTTEVGPVVMIGAAAGLVVLGRRRAAFPVVLGYLAFAIPTLFVLLGPAFQPPRNVMPLVPFLVIAAAAAIVGLADVVGTRLHVPRDGRTAVAVVVVGLCVFPTTTWAYVRDNRGHSDTRTSVTDWLNRRVRPGEHVLVSEEVAFLPQQLEEICAHVEVASQRLAEPVTDYDWVIVGDLDGGHWQPLWTDALGPRQPTLTVGAYRTSGEPGNTTMSSRLEDVWHFNNERIHAYGPAAGAARGPRRGPCPLHHRRIGTPGPIAVVPGHASIREGDAGPTTLRVPVTLSHPSATPVTVEWQTTSLPTGTTVCRKLERNDNVAAAGPDDVAPAHGTVTFAPRSTQASVAVAVVGDRAREPTECVFLTFRSLTPGVGSGGLYGLSASTIVDDD